MDSGIVTSVISASSAVIIAGLAIASNTYWIGRSFDELARSLNQFRVDVNKRLDTIEADLKEIVKITNDLDKRLDRLEQQKK
jgi:ABC-type transporter Mla subunit MlaD